MRVSMMGDGLAKKRRFQRAGAISENTRSGGDARGEVASTGVARSWEKVMVFGGLGAPVDSG